VPVSREFLSAIDLLPEPMLLVGTDGGILAANQAFARQLGRPAEDFLGTPLSLLITDSWSAVTDYLQRCARSDRLLAGSLTLRHPNGATLEFRAGGAGYSSGESRPVSGAAPCVLLRLEARADSAGFLAVLAHELRNPLAPIRNALEVMRVSAGDQAVTTAARSMIERQLQQLVRLIDSLTAKPAAATAAPEGPGRKPPMLRTRILVADDNRDAAQSLAFMLEIEGHDVRTAHDGLEAIQIGESFRPQVVLLDIGMPRLDGYATAREVRGRSWGISVCLVALTGWGQEEDRRRAEEAGFDRYLVKPVDPQILNALIAQALQT
jgi:CheY-like chemotaxis protein